MSVCPECNGTGEYRGLNVVEPCRACSVLRDKNGEVCRNSSGEPFQRPSNVKHFVDWDAKYQPTVSARLSRKDQIEISSHMNTSEYEDCGRIIKVPIGIVGYAKFTSVECSAGCEELMELLANKTKMKLEIHFYDGTSHTQPDMTLESFAPVEDGTFDLHVSWHTVWLNNA